MKKLKQRKTKERKEDDENCERKLRRWKRCTKLKEENELITTVGVSVCMDVCICDVACQKWGLCIWWQFWLNIIMLEHFLSFKMAYSFKMINAIKCYKFEYCLFFILFFLAACFYLFLKKHIAKSSLLMCRIT